MLNPSAAVADPELRMSQAMWAAGDGSTLAEYSPGRIREAAAVGGLLSHPRAMATATVTNSDACNLMSFIAPPFPFKCELQMANQNRASRRATSTPPQLGASRPRRQHAPD